MEKYNMTSDMYERLMEDEMCGGTNSELHIACFNGNYTRVKELLDGGANIWARNRLNELPLHVVVRSSSINVETKRKFTLERLEIMKELIYRDKTMVNDKSLCGRTALYYATLMDMDEVMTIENKSGYEKRVVRVVPVELAFGAIKLLVENGADVNENVGNMDEMRTPLKNVCENFAKNPEIALYLINNGAIIYDPKNDMIENETILYDVCKNMDDNNEIVLEIIERAHKERPLRTWVFMEDGKTRTVLCHALEYGKIKMAKKMLEGGLS